MTTIKEALRFVKGVAGKNTLNPALEHYRIADGRVTGFNGHFGISAPIPLDITACPKADVFYKAIEKTEQAEAVSVYLTDGGKLAIRGGKLAAYVPCLEEFPYEIAPTGERHPVPETFLEDIERLQPFISEDASRLWSQGLLFDAGTVTATNNIVLAQIWNGHQLPRINLPKFMVAEAIRLKEKPIAVQVSEGSLSLLYENGAWISGSLLVDAWPVEILNKILSAETSPAPIPEGLSGGLEELASFTTDGKSSPVYFTSEGLATSPHKEDGATFSLAGIPEGPVFNLMQMRAALTLAENIDFDGFPNPCLFTGPRLRGAILGRRG